MDNFVEYLIVAAVLLWSCYVVLRRFLPKTSFKLQQRMAIWLGSLGLTWLGNRLLPKASQSGCSVGCSGCSVEKPQAKVSSQLKGSSLTKGANSECASMRAGQQNTQTHEDKEQPVQWRI